MDPLQCCFKYCENGTLIQESARVEIKSAIPNQGLKKYEKTFLVLWKQNGEAMFHPVCWEVLLTLARRRNTDNRKRKPSKKATTSTNDHVMIFTEKVMIKEASKTAERFNSADDINQNAMKVAEMILQSKHCVFFTGAGISTSAGLGDYRGKGGKWTEQDRDALDVDSLLNEEENCQPSTSASPEKKPRLSESGSSSESKTEKTQSMNNTSTETEDEEEIIYEDLRPTFTHEAISKLAELGHVKYLISQNCDGLHLLSGLPSGSMSELHGNVFVEKCEKCHEKYERSFYVCDDIGDMYLEELSDYGKTDIIAPKFLKKCPTCGLSHRTGRRCEKKSCKGYLMDTIINFGDLLEDSILDRAFEAADACDMMVCLGTTLMVTPANELVDYVRNPRRIVICNRQRTDKDEACQERDDKGNTLGVRVYGDCDNFMRYLMSHILGKKFELFEKEIEQKAKRYDKLRTIQS